MVHSLLKALPVVNRFFNAIQSRANSKEEFIRILKRVLNSVFPIDVSCNHGASPAEKSIL